NLEEDAPIWKSKRYLTRPLLCDGDGPYAQLRHWTRQFFIAESEAEGMNVEKKPSPPALGRDEPVVEVQSSGIAAPTSAVAESPPTPARPTSVGPAPADGARAGDIAHAVARIFFEKMPAEFNPTAVTSDFVVQYDIGGEEGAPYF